MYIPYWRLSSFYFIYFAALGAFVPYWSLYLKSVGFNSDTIGELTALLVSTKMISPNLWGWIADYTGKGLRIIQIASFFTALLFAGFLFLQGYVWFAVITLSFSFFWNAALPQFEALTLRYVKTEPHRYSKIRLWGSVGFIVSVLSVGQLVDKLDIVILPVVIISFLSVLWIVSLFVPDIKTHPKHSKTTGLWSILKRTEVLAFLLVSLLVQLAHAPYYAFYSIYLKHYDYSASYTGLLWTLGVVAEIVLFIYMQQLLKRISLRVLLLCSLLLSVLRWWLIAYYVNIEAIIIGAQLLHAATFGGTHIAAMHLIYHYFGEAHQGKGQALYTSLSFGLGGVLGSLYAGYAWETQSPEFVFLIAAMCCALAFLLAYIWVRD
ncbi:putative 3-phenylpropionic acid transporter [Patescibacteria group bacterium]|nr:putative 3-phenylpropionic acid transporter [Patescibacteria group bacterium]